MEPRQFGNYALLEHVGKGRVGSVFRARHNRDNTVVAVKVFESGDEDTPQTSRELRDREVRMLMSVQHPNVVKFLGSGQVGDDYYYSMEFVENNLLSCMRGESDFSLVDKVHVLRQTASALVAIHHQGIVHRDVKPGNILLDRDPNGAIHVKLTDLGIAKNVSETDIVRQRMPSRIPGTPKYLSPEQIRLRPVDGRADVFSLGVAAYQLTGGVPPFDAATSKEYLRANTRQHPAPVCEVAEDVPEFLGRIIEKMLAKDREERYDSEALLRDLELAEQHLVSGAPLIERTNPGSLFYEPPPGGPSRGAIAELRRAVVPLSWGLALAITAAGVALSVLLWPAAPPEAEAGPRPLQPPAHAPRDVLQEIAAGADGGRYWQAFVLLEGPRHEGLSPQGRDELQRLSERVHEELTEELYSCAMKMLEQDRDAEAEIVLRRMREQLPAARRTRQLGEAIRHRQLRAALEERWETAVRGTQALMREHRYEEALAAGVKLLQDFGGDEEKARTAGRMMGDLFDSWGRDLLETRADVDAILGFFRAVDAHPRLASGTSSALVTGELRLKLADAYRARGDYGLALEHYEIAMASSDADVARRAGQATGDVRRRMVQVPHEAAPFARELARRGFQSDLWDLRTAPDASQQVVDGVLQLRSRGTGRETIVYRESVRPVRNRGFALGVRFRATPEMLARPGFSRAGIGLASINGNIFEFYFDGRSYWIVRKSGQTSAGRAVRAAVGDEDREWHTLGLRYSPDARRLAVMLDGKEIQHHPVNLSDFRLRVFLVASRHPAGADFEGVYCRPMGGP